MNKDSNPPRIPLLDSQPHPPKRIKLDLDPPLLYTEENIPINPTTPAPGTQSLSTTSTPAATPPANLEAAALEEEYQKKSGDQRKGCLYVDAFNLALDTVLGGEECKLFSEEEMEVFKRWRGLGVEEKYLYVRLFLRKTSSWFRINKLNYHSTIPDIPATCRILQNPDFGFADSEEEIKSLEEAAGLLNLDELKVIAKEAKIRDVNGINKGQLVKALKSVSERQRGLRFDGWGSGRGDRDGWWMEKIFGVTGPHIRLRPSTTSIFHRLHLVFHRSTEWTENSLTTTILSRIQRRNFPSYIVSRTSSIFPTRLALLEFEEAIKLQSSVDEALENPSIIENLMSVKTIFESIWDRWNDLVKEEEEKTNERKGRDEQEELMERGYLRRFTAAWVLTRIVHKGVYVLGRFKEYTREHQVLEKLLSQKFFHTARRGGWYQRKALIEENYMATTTTNEKPSETEKKKWRKLALETCERGLQDPETHLVYHYELQKRITKLEQKLKVSKREQHEFGHALLRKPSERVIVGERVNEVAVGRKTLWKKFVGDGEVGEEEEEGVRGGFSVEEMCLSKYRLEGWKGFHSEGGIVRTLFAYLFYDILFLYVPNVFETEFQNCPLDLFTDAFYPSRASEINHRLVDIENGNSPRFIREIDDKHRERKTSVVGLDWSYDCEDLVEIVECLGGEALSIICKVLCQEYRHSTSGLPDLLLWNPTKKQCLFSEVKSENDRLSDTQRLWIHILTACKGVGVEVCKAVDGGRGGKK